MKLERAAGVVLHLTALPGPHGIGDIGDSARNFIELLAETGLSVWQFLPAGPTAYGHSPYQPLSAFAGNPLLIGLDPLVRLGLLSGRETDDLRNAPEPYTDYDRVLPAKRALLQKAAARFLESRSQRLGPCFEAFCQRHGARWLDDFALFRVLKSRHGERAWADWDEPFRNRDRAALEAFSRSERDSLERIKAIQFLFDLQWHELKQHAGLHGVRLFGDMPIYIALDSADAWAQREMLQLDANGRPRSVAGVPPDYFSKSGQLWGNPLYDWDHHRRTGYRWWIERVRHASRRVDLVRIDHFRAFESYWSVPANTETARAGTWKAGPGDEIFDAVHEELGTLPIVAENLGVITPEVEELRRRHNIPGMIVLQFELADPDFDVMAVDQDCVCYTGTHDNDTTAGWFRGGGDDTRSPTEVARDRRNALTIGNGSARTIASDLIRLAYSSPAAIAMAPMQDYLGLGSEARFNRPGTTRGNWRWRLRPDQLSPHLIREIRKMVRAAARDTAAATP